MRQDKPIKVLEAVEANNPADGYPSNGMQAMAVAPAINGVVNTTRIIISYAAGSDYSNEENTDLVSEFETLVGGGTQFVPLFSTLILPGQSVTTKQFADSVIAQYPEASIALTGFSTGGYLALAVGAEDQLPVFAISGPDPSHILTASEIAFVKAHPALYIDITDTWDTVMGSLGGNTLGTRVYYDAGFTLDPMLAHVGAYTFNSSGAITSPETPLLGSLINTLASSIDPILGFFVSEATQVLAVIDTTLVPEMTAIYNLIGPFLGPIPELLESGLSLVASAVSSVTNPIVTYYDALSLRTSITVV